MIQKNVSLTNKNTLGIHCQAEYYIEIHQKNDWNDVFSWIHENPKSPKIYIIGLGSNIVLPTGILFGLTIIIKNQDYHILHEQKDSATVQMSAGAILGTMIIKLSQNNIDLSALAGFPSTIGGAIRGNAGLQGIALGDFLDEAVILDLHTQQTEIWKQKDFDFSYRFSNLKTMPHKVFLQGTFTISKSSNSLKQSCNIIKKRKLSQPQDNSSGCFFSNPIDPINNPKQLGAGFLIDSCELKGKTIGGAQVSYKHANFFINTSKATQNDFLQLMTFVQKSVYMKYNITLKNEVEIIQK
jgi:UDP-N-acetylmuramate dehydrogenase